MEEGTQPLPIDNCVVQDNESYQSNIIRTDLSKEFLEEDNANVAKPDTGLTEVMITIEGKEVKTLVDTGSEVSVISEHMLDELKEVNKNIPALPVAGITTVGITGVRSKCVTKQVQLNMIINGGEYENTFLVVRGLNLEVILGNDFLIRHKAVIDFNKRVLELDKEIKPVRVSFESLLDTVRTSGVKVIQKRVSSTDTEARVNTCSEKGSNESKERIWENRAHKFCSESRGVGSPQCKALWRVVKNLKRFAELPGRARNYEV